MQHYNIHKKIFGIIALFTLLTSLLLSAVPIRIMPLGDSITRGHTNTLNDPNDSGYRNYLWYKLNDANYSVDFVGSLSTGAAVVPVFDTDHDGYNGATTADINNNITTYLTAVDPQIILLHIGTNDLDEPGYDITTSTNNVESILDKIYDHNSSIKVILARIINRATTHSDTTAFNDSIEAMASTHIADIDIIDMENGAGIDYTIGVDMENELHPNDSGYEKMANLWYSVLQSVIPQHLWKLEEATGSTVYLDTYREANGTCIGASCPTEVIGKIGNAQAFDGTDEINVTQTTTIDWTADESFTIDFWIKTGVATVNGQNNVMIGRKSGSNTTGLAWFVAVNKDNAGKILFGLNDSNDPSHTLTNGATPVDDDLWHHIALVRDGVNNENRIYVDGTLDGTPKSVTYDADFNESTEPLMIGYLDWDVGFNYEGILDEIAIFNSALSAGQIQKRYQDTQPDVLSIISEPVTSAEINTPYLYDVNSSNDPNATFVLNTSPTWMNIDTDFGVIDGTPDAVGNFDVEVEAVDGVETAIQNYVLKVRNTAVLPSEMNHYWMLDELTGPTYLDSYSGADGTCTDPDCPTAVAGKIDGAQTFDGTDEINVTQTTTLNWSADANFTLEFWMKTDTKTVVVDGYSKNNVMMGRKSTSNTSGLAWFIAVDQANQGKIVFGLNDSNDGVHTLINGNTPVNDDVWHHIVCVRDGTNNITRIYVDGFEDANLSHTYDTDFNEGTAPLNIGYLDWDFNPQTGGYYYQGILDEIIIFDSALTPTIIQQHYDNGQSGIGFGADVTPPVITLVGSDVSIELGTPYSDEGATATDNIDGNITSNIVTVNPVNANSVGVYTVTYDVNDSAGNPATQVTRTVTVTADVTPPVITLIGSDVSIELGTPYSDEGATATDNIDGNITAKIVTVNPVNVNSVGVYTVTYDVNDSSGNPATQVTRTVNVTADATPPVISLVGNTPIDIWQGSMYIDSGASAVDNIDGNITENIVTVNPVDTDKIGQYIVTYDVNDSAGNAATQVTRTVNVVDGTIPIITLLGANPQVILLGEAYTELNATAQDDVDGDISANIVIDASSVDTSNLGQYTVTYDVNDSAGNMATQVTRTVNVVEAINVDTIDTSSGGGCSYNPNSKNFDMTFLLMIALGLFYPFRRRFIK